MESMTLMRVKTKADYALDILNADAPLLVWVDGRSPDADIPKSLWEKPIVGLRFYTAGYTPPIPDLDVDPEEGIYGTLHFRGVPFQCKIPWSIIWAIQNAETYDGCVWEGDVPHDARMQWDAIQNEGAVPARERAALLWASDATVLETTATG